MNKIEQAGDILKKFGLPAAQHNELAALVLLGLCGITEHDAWKDATNESLGVTKGLMSFVNANYNRNYAPNTRETFRRQVLHFFVQARIADLNPSNPLLPVNSPKTHYALTSEALEVIKQYQTKTWDKALQDFHSNFEKLTELYLKARQLHHIPVNMSDGTVITLSAGKHNKVQAAIIEEFAPRFANGGHILYVGDTAKKDLYVMDDELKKLGIPIDQHSKLPDVVIYDPIRKWLFLVEAVTSHGPVSPKRIVELEKLLSKCDVGKIYVTAFPDISEFKKHSSNIAWETEVWLMDVPDHMIHFNGDRFMGPR